ncbi:MAG: AAA family ATPase [Anaerolineales bacterium]|nr:MAG: AAA family ATPase [Anaerolineales bacterium]
MRLEKIEYSQFDGQPKEWKVDECSFGLTNLIIGKNATGKTRLLNIIRGLASNIAEGGKLRFGEGNYRAEFSIAGKSYVYFLKYHQRVVESEKLIIDKELYLTRDAKGEGKLKAEKVGDDIDFKIDSDQIAVATKRDSIQHSYLDDLHTWAKSVARYDFGGGLGKDQILLRLGGEARSDNDIRIDIRKTDQVVRIFIQALEELKDSFSQSILEDMKYLGYEIEAVGVDALEGISIDSPLPISVSAPPIGLYLKESDLPIATGQHEMSDGMFSALSVLAQVSYALATNQVTCLLVDDIGQGLDYERSSALVKRVVDKAERASTQLIMTTNDRFIMNAIPLEKWIVLVRTGGLVQNLNYRNSKELFDEFDDTGLNNFDFFSSGYYRKKTKK